MHFAKSSTHETHQVSISKSKNLVPNFAGRSLPRCDKVIESITVYNVNTVQTMETLVKTLRMMTSLGMKLLRL